MKPETLDAMDELIRTDPDAIIARTRTEIEAKAYTNGHGYDDYMTRATCALACSYVPDYVDEFQARRRLLERLSYFDDPIEARLEDSYASWALPKIIAACAIDQAKADLDLAVTDNSDWFSDRLLDGIDLTQDETLKEVLKL